MCIFRIIEYILYSLSQRLWTCAYTYVCTYIHVRSHSGSRVCRPLDKQADIVTPVIAVSHHKTKLPISTILGSPKHSRMADHPIPDLDYDEDLTEGFEGPSFLQMQNYDGEENDDDEYFDEEDDIEASPPPAQEVQLGDRMSPQTHSR